MSEVGTDFMQSRCSVTQLRLCPHSRTPSVIQCQKSFYNPNSFKGLVCNPAPFFFLNWLLPRPKSFALVETENRWDPVLLWNSCRSRSSRIHDLQPRHQLAGSRNNEAHCSQERKARVITEVEQSPQAMFFFFGFTQIGVTASPPVCFGLACWKHAAILG